MPDWVRNRVIVKHEDHSMLQQMAVAYNAGELCNEFVPCPPTLVDTRGNVTERTKRERTNKTLYGHKTGYEWRLANWGCGHEFGLAEGDDPVEVNTERDGAPRLLLMFDTANSPPLELYEELGRRGFNIKAIFCSNALEFCGTYGNGDLEWLTN